MTYKYAIYAILACTVFVVGCQREAAGPGPTVDPTPLNLVKQGSIDLEREH